MADMKDGFSVSFKQGTDMLTIQGVDYETFKQNLAAFCDDSEGPEILRGFVPPAMAPSDAEALDNIAATLGATAPAPAAVADEAVQSGVSAPPVEAGPHQTCNVATANGPCGTVKDEWKPGGVRGNGSKYDGFWGCPNWQNHLKKRR